MRTTLIWLAFLMAALAAARAADTTPEYVKPGSIPQGQLALLEAVGKRFQTPGSERVVMTGTLDRRAGGPTGVGTATITVQFPGLFRFDGVTAPGSFIFAGAEIQKNSGSAGKTEEDLADAFLMDSMDGFMQLQLGGVRAYRWNRIFKITDPRTANAFRISLEITYPY